MRKTPGRLEAARVSNQRKLGHPFSQEDPSCEYNPLRTLTSGSDLSDEVENIKRRIWITERCHMNAERRNRRYELYFHILLAAYSIVAIGYNILETSHKVSVGDDVFLFLSVFTLALSLLIFGFKFGETAAQHRTCYLALQKLRFENHTAEELNNKYVSTIGNLPNHTTQDFLNVAISNVFSRTQEMSSAEGRRYEFSHFSRLRFVLTHIMIWMTALALFSPIIYILLVLLAPICPIK